MLDLLFNFKKAERHPVEMIIIAIFYSSLSILLGSWVFEGESLAVVFLTVLSCLYLVQNAVSFEERKEKNFNSEKWVMKKHKGIVVLVTSLFIGFLISFTLWSYLLPQETGSQVFNLQKDAVDRIRAITGNAVFPDALSIILGNNLRIILISLVFAIFYGAGAIYILVWNASVMGFVIGSVAKESAGVISIPLAMIKYSLHGIPEMIAYIIAAIAGGILYVSFIKGDLVKTERVKRLAIDTGLLIAISAGILVISAFIEVYISTLL